MFLGKYKIKNINKLCARSDELYIVKVRFFGPWDHRLSRYLLNSFAYYY